MSATGIYGLSGSGIDVDSMVKVGMMSKQNEYDRMYKKEVRQEWTKQAYADLYSDLNKFNGTTMSKYKMSSTLNPQSVSSTNTAVATATANADAAAMTHVVNVKQSATNAYLLTGDGGITRENGNTGSIYLKDVIDTDLLGDDGSLEFTVSDGQNSSVVTITREQIVSSNQTLNDLAAAFNGTGLNIKASYDATNDSFSLYNSTGGSQNGIYLTAGVTRNSAFSANEAGLQLLKNLNLHTVTTTTENGVAESKLSTEEVSYTDAAGQAVQGGKWTTDTITAALGDGTNMTLATTADLGRQVLTIDGTSYDVSNYNYDRDTDTYTFDYQKDGNTVNVTIGALTDGSRAVTTSVGGEQQSIGTATESIATSEYGGMSGDDAIAVIDGKTYTSATNKLTVANVTYNLLATGSSTLTVTQDTDKVVENVLKFVEDYNEMLGKLNDMYNEQKYADYDVLTESQKKGMTQEQIEKWEEKAKSGLMYHNQTVGKLISAMREAIYTPVESVDPYRTDANGKEYTYSTLMSIGIESKTDRGILRVDEDKLRAAIANDPDCVYQLFGSLDTENDSFSKNGVAQRLGDIANDSLKEIKTYAGTSSESADGSSLGNLIEEMKKKMSDFKTMLNAFENSLYKKYDAMESAIQRLGVSLGYITGGQ